MLMPSGNIDILSTFLTRVCANARECVYVFTLCVWNWGRGGGGIRLSSQCFLPPDPVWIVLSDI